MRTFEYISYSRSIAIAAGLANNYAANATAAAAALTFRPEVSHGQIVIDGNKTTAADCIVLSRLLCAVIHAKRHATPSFI